MAFIAPQEERSASCRNDHLGLKLTQPKSPPNLVRNCSDWPHCAAMVKFPSLQTSRLRNSAHSLNSSDSTAEHGS